jgi:hypothetical protein
LFFYLDALFADDDAVRSMEKQEKRAGINAAQALR